VHSCGVLPGAILQHRLGQGPNRRHKAAGVYTVYDGHCSLRQKEKDHRVLMVITMHNGMEYRFYGHSATSLHVETGEGIADAQLVQSAADRAVFRWGVAGATAQLALQIDTVQPPRVSYDDTADAARAQAMQQGLDALLNTLFR
jgi:hypothetical protein